MHHLFLLHSEFFFFKILFLQLHLKVFNVVNVFHQFIKLRLSTIKKLLDLFFVLLNPLNKFTLSFWFLFKLLLFEQLWVQGLLIAKILLVDHLSQLIFRFLRCRRSLTTESILDSGQVFSCTKVTVTTKSRYLMTLGIVHLCVLYGAVIIATKLFDSDLPMIQLS